MKICKACGLVKPFTEYYKTPRASDGHFGKCKQCVKEYYRKHYSVPENASARAVTQAIFAATDTERMKRKAYFKTDKGKEVKRAADKTSKEEYPDRKRAVLAVYRAVKTGVLIRLPCWVCGELDVEGHHPAYNMPLDVIWLCKKHHDEIHHDKHENANLTKGTYEEL